MFLFTRGPCALQPCNLSCDAMTKDTSLGDVYGKKLMCFMVWKLESSI